MKRIFTIAAALLMTASVWAQAPEKMSYQAVVRDAGNALVTSQAVGMQLSILQGSTSGSSVYTETQTPTTNINGLVSIEIGSGTVVTGTFNTIDWSAGPYFIKTETDPTGGTTYTITGTSQLMSVPYALHANTADSIVGGVSITETDPVFGASIANGITAIDTANWNNHTVDTDTQLDSTDIASLGYVAGLQNIDNTLSVGNDAGNNNLVNLGQLTIGSSSTTASTSLEINSTSGALLLPRMTTAERNVLTPSLGMLIYNTIENKFQGYRSFDSPIASNNLSSGSGCTTGSRGQSFQPTNTGNMIKIEVNTTTINTPGNWTLNIYNGAGLAGTLLGSQSVSITSAGIISVTLSTPIPVISGQSYTFNFTSTGGANACFSYQNPQSYSTGDMYVDNVVNGAFDMEFTVFNSDSWVDLH
jgi:hypothetical protein